MMQVVTGALETTPKALKRELEKSEIGGTAVMIKTVAF